MRFVDAFDAGRLGTLVLGAAQLGMDYGVANKDGKPDRHRVSAILSAAWRAGVAVIDTAQAYGDSERVIGEHLRSHPERTFHVISKLAPATDHGDSDAVFRAGQSSRERIGQPLAALMLHDASALRCWKDGLHGGLQRCVDEGVAENIGASVYTPTEFLSVLEIPEIRVLQAPFNALDRRLLDTGLLARAVDSGRIVILRSVFLQGLLVLEQADLPERFQFAATELMRWRRLCAQNGESCAAVAVGFVRRAAPRALIVIGSERAEQVEANAALLAGADLPESLFSAINSMPAVPERIVNPTLWPRT